MTENGGDLSLEVSKASLIAFDRLRVISQTDTALVGYDGYGVPGQQRADQQTWTYGKESMLLELLAVARTHPHEDP